ncbi:HepT-like ribonuclease domain-containing protein [Caminibacter sp.]
MKSESPKIEFILLMIENIKKFFKRHNGIVNALNDFESQAAILMFLMQIGETLNKIKDALEVYVDKEDIKGAYVVRNFIAHDYEGVDLAFIENILRFKLNELKIQLKN